MEKQTKIIIISTLLIGLLVSIVGIVLVICCNQFATTSEGINVENSKAIKTIGLFFIILGPVGSLLNLGIRFGREKLANLFRK